MNTGLFEALPRKCLIFQCVRIARDFAGFLAKKVELRAEKVELRVEMVEQKGELS